MSSKLRRKERGLSSREVANLVKGCLDQGDSVELEGLGRFRKGSRGEFLFEAFVRPKVFIAYVEEDVRAAHQLCEQLMKYCDPWLDRDRLLAGQNWPRRIEHAIQFSDCFLALFSKRSVSKRGQFQSELRYALDCATKVPLDRTFVLPVRLEPCEVPASIKNSLQYVDMFPDWDAGLKRLLRAIRPLRNSPRSSGLRVSS